MDRENSRIAADYTFDISPTEAKTASATIYDACTTLCFPPGVLFHSRVTGVCTVATDLFMRDIVTTTTTTTTTSLMLTANAIDYILQYCKKVSKFPRTD